MADARTRAEALSMRRSCLASRARNFRSSRRCRNARTVQALWSTAQEFSKNLPVAQRADDGDRPRGGRGRGEGAVEGELQDDQTFNEMAPDDASDQTPPLKVAEALKVNDEFQEKLPLISAM